MPAVRSRAPAWLSSQPIAHRGLHDGERAENSLAAFEAAVEHGYAIELDVHHTRAGELLVFHDDDLARMTGEAGPVDALERGASADLRLRPGGEAVPTLAQALAHVRGRAPIVLDLKSKRRPGALERAVAATIAGYRGALALQSYQPFALAELRRLAPERTRGLLVSDFRDAQLAPHERFALANALLSPLARPHYVAWELRCLPSLPAGVLRRLGLPLIAWTIADPAALARAHAVADNVIFEGVRP